MDICTAHVTQGFGEKKLLNSCTAAEITQGLWYTHPDTRMNTASLLIWGAQVSMNTSVKKTTFLSFIFNMPALTCQTSSTETMWGAGTYCTPCTDTLCLSLVLPVLLLIPPLFHLDAFRLIVGKVPCLERSPQQPVAVSGVLHLLILLPSLPEQPSPLAVINLNSINPLFR